MTTPFCHKEIKNFAAFFKTNIRSNESKKYGLSVYKSQCFGWLRRAPKCAAFYCFVMVGVRVAWRRGKEQINTCHYLRRRADNGQTIFQSCFRERTCAHRLGRTKTMASWPTMSIFTRLSGISLLF